MKGNITKRGERSWRIKFDVGRCPKMGKRLTRYITFKGTKREAEAERARLIASFHAGADVAPSRVTVAAFMRQWLDDAEATKRITPKTMERYWHLNRDQISPHLGATLLQKLKASALTTWHATLLREGRVDKGPLSARTVGHAHRLLGTALADALKHDLIAKNPCTLVSPPKVSGERMKILTADEIKIVLAGLEGSVIYAEVVIMLSTGMRVGETLGLRWGSIDFENRKILIERSIEATQEYGLRIKEPKTIAGRRYVRLSDSATEALRSHRRERLEIRFAFGLNKLPDDHHIFGDILSGEPGDPRLASKRWSNHIKARKLPRVRLHDLRHTCASALIASGLDLVTIAHQLGHADPTVTLKIYGHLFDRSDARAAAVMDALMKKA